MTKKKTAVKAKSAKAELVPATASGPELSFERFHAEKVAKLLVANKRLTLVAACIDAGLGKHFSAIKRAMLLARRGHAANFERIEPILRAIETQCEGLLGTAEDLADRGKSANLYQWWAETKNPLEYGLKVRTELTGEDGGPVEVKKTLAGKSDDELVGIMLAAKNAQNPIQEDD